MITNTTNPFSFYSVLSTQNIPSTYVVITGSKYKGFRWGINTWSLTQVTTFCNHKYTTSNVEALNVNTRKALLNNHVSTSGH
jgi:hypothetical protein